MCLTPNQKISKNVHIFRANYELYSEYSSTGRSKKIDVRPFFVVRRPEKNVVGGIWVAFLLFVTLKNGREDASAPFVFPLISTVASILSTDSISEQYSLFSSYAVVAFTAELWCLLKRRFGHRAVIPSESPVLLTHSAAEWSVYFCGDSRGKKGFDSFCVFRFPFLQLNRATQKKKASDGFCRVLPFFLRAK